MIYTIISSTKNRIEENRDCRALRQPLSHLPKEVDEFISSTKNDSLRAERFLAYTSLLCGLKVFYGIDNASVKKDLEGKPYLVYDSDNAPEIHISISHSEGTVAVSISDEGEIGVDIQCKISAERAERLKDRFFGDVEIHSGNIGVKYYYCHISENEALLEEVILEDADSQDYTTRWAYSESVMKLYGRGFGDLTILSNLAKQCKNEVKRSIDSLLIIANSIKM